MTDNALNTIPPADYPEFRRSRLVDLLLSLEEGESRTLERVIEEVPETARFFSMAIGEGRFTIDWLNAPHHSASPRNTVPYLPAVRANTLAMLEPPRYRCVGRFDDSRHVFPRFPALLVTERLLDCISALDTADIEVREASVEGVPAGVRFYLIMSHRVIDPIDLARTTVVAKNYQIAPGVIFMRKLDIPDGYTVREDLPPTWHFFENMFTGEILWSIELIERARAAGVRGIDFWRTERGRAPSPILFTI